jgi:hypothetical protein
MVNYYNNAWKNGILTLTFILILDNLHSLETYSRKSAIHIYMTSKNWIWISIRMMGFITSSASIDFISRIIDNNQDWCKSLLKCYVLLIAECVMSLMQMSAYAFFVKLYHFNKLLFSQLLPLSFLIFSAISILNRLNILFFIW